MICLQTILVCAPLNAPQVMALVVVLVRGARIKPGFVFGPALSTLLIIGVRRAQDGSSKI